MPPMEVILVDDGSGDGTGAVLEAIAERFGRDWARVTSLPENRGPAAARNAGWEAARGQAIAFLDADDAWHRRKIELQWSFMEAHPKVAICGHGHRRVADLAAIPEPAAMPAAVDIDLQALLASNRFITPSVMLRRELPLRFRADRRHMEDHLLWLEAAAKGYRLVRLEAALAGIFKREFGDSGLSAQVVRMTAADIGNYWLLAREGLISVPVAALYSAWACLKAVRRWLILLARGALPQARRGSDGAGGSARPPA
jgi:glycosyltransferase involved in cell wall biosynthesis